MIDPNKTTNGVADSDPVASPDHAADHPHAISSGDVVFHDEIEAGPILAEILSAGDHGGGELLDLHAAISSLPAEAFDSLDIAAHHLTTSIDLFDVPVVHSGDVADGSA